METELKKAGERKVTQYEGPLLKITLTTGETVLALCQHGQFFELERIHNEFIMDDHEIMMAYVSSWPIPESILPHEPNGFTVNPRKIRPICKVVVENNLPYLMDSVVDLGTRPHYLIITKLPK